VKPIEQSTLLRAKRGVEQGPFAAFFNNVSQGGTAPAEGGGNETGS
jgi:hypothetical protein